MKQNEWLGTIWPTPDNQAVCILDQRRLPHEVSVVTLRTLDDACWAIADMLVRGAGLIGNTAAYGLWLAARELAERRAERGADLADNLAPQAFLDAVRMAAERLKATRPTAGNLAWAVDRQLAALEAAGSDGSFGAGGAVAGAALLRRVADELAASEREAGRRIGEYGKTLIAGVAARKPGRVINILTHCNAGKLAFVDYGSALAPVYAAHTAGLPVHVWVDETRPRNQGALTAWELARHDVPHTLIVDNAGGHLMQHGQVDMVIVGADRVTRQGDAANKIGTYLKALAARDNDVPFYVALPASTFDLELDGGSAIPIEERDGEEVLQVTGLTADERMETVRICPAGTLARNWAFDVTPARLITGFICERGICQATEAAILDMLR
jgi:methylthioribose-1-phosphate isomerase